MGGQRDDPDRAASARSAATAWIDDYLAGLPADQRAALQALRATIARAAPEAEEAISYRIPAFRYHGRILVWYHAAKRHCSFFPTAEPIERHRAELAGFSVAKGTIRFAPDHPIPETLVERIISDRMATIDAEVRQAR